MKQLVGSSSVGVSTLPVSDVSMLKRLPCLLKYLQEDRYDDGEVRTRSTMTIFVQDGMVKVCLNDKDSNMSLFRSGSGLVQALDALEKDLAGTDQLDWKPWNQKKRGK